MYKRILALTLALLMIVSFAACVKHETPAATEETTTATTTEMTIVEKTKAEELAEYLAGVTYRKFEFTDSTEPYFMGRWFEKEINGENHMVSVTSGSHLYFLTDGAESFDVNFTVITTSATPPTFAYSIDGGTPVRQLITESKVELPDSKPHTVRIIADGMYEMEGKWEAEKGFALKGITPSEGGAIYGIKPTNKIIFYYGDSITEGIYALSENYKGNSAVNSFTWHSAEALGATPYFIGYGGTGFTQGIEQKKSFATMIEAIDYNTKNRPVEDGIIPDVIVISHGTNENQTPALEYVAAGKAAIDRLNEKYPGTPIIYLGHYNYYNVKNAASKKITEDYDNVYWVSSQAWNVTFTDKCHPNAAGAKVLGTKFAEAMIDILGEDFFK